MSTKPKYNKKKKKKGGYGKYANTAYKALKLANEMKWMLNVEYKAFDASQTSTNVSWNGLTYNIFTPAQGDAVNQREGDRCKVTSISVKLIAEANSAAPKDFVRVFLYTVNDTDAGINVIDIIDPTNNNLATIAPKTLANVGKYKILADRTISFDGNQNSVHLVKIFKKKEIHVKMDQGLSTVDQNRICLGIISSANPAGNMPTIRWYTRIRYVDN